MIGDGFIGKHLLLKEVSFYRLGERVNPNICRADAAFYIWDQAGDYCDYFSGTVPAGEKGIEDGGALGDWGVGAVVVYGLFGAVMATVAVFLPSFVFVALLNPLVPRMRRSKLFSAFLDGVNVASVAIIVTVCVFCTADGDGLADGVDRGAESGSDVCFRKVNTVFGYLLLRLGPISIHR